MADEVTVRLCEESDLPELRAHEAHPDVAFADQHYALQRQGDYFYAVAFKGEHSVGTIALDCRPNDLQPEMKNLWVYKDARRQGVGSTLVAFVEDLARDAGFEEIFLGVDPENPRAIPLYVGLEYSPTGDHRMAAYVFVDDDGKPAQREQRDAIYRKSLKFR